MSIVLMSALFFCILLACWKLVSMAQAEERSKAARKALKNVEKAKKAGHKYDTDEYYIDRMYKKYNRE